MSTTREDSTVDWVEQIGKPAYESIADMVAALECDFDRLEELRESKSDYTPTCEECGGEVPDECDGLCESDSPKYQTWAEANPDDAEELADLEKAAGDCSDAEDARQRIEEDPLSLRIFGERTDGEWIADRFELLLGTGGPAVRIMGELADGEPTRAWLEVQDWFKPWTQYIDADQDTLLTYCQCFYFGE